MGKTKYTLAQQQIIIETYHAFLVQGYSFKLIMEFIIASQLILVKHQEVVLELLHAGSDLSSVLVMMKFDGEVINAVKNGQQVGDMTTGLVVALGWLKQKQNFISQIKQAITYPLVLVGFAAIAFLFVFFFLFPQIESFLASYQVNEKPFIFTLLELLVLFISVGLGAGTLIVISICFIQLFANTQRLQVYIKFPVVRYYVQHFLQILLANRLSLYLSNGISCFESFQQIIASERKDLLQAQVVIVDGFLKNGFALDDALSRTGFYSQDFLLVMQFAIKNNTIGKECELYSERAMIQLQARLVSKLKGIQLLMTISIALFLVLTYMAIFLPMLSVFDNI